MAMRPTRPPNIPRNGWLGRGCLFKFLAAAEPIDEQVNLPVVLEKGTHPVHTFTAKSEEQEK